MAGGSSTGPDTLTVLLRCVCPRTRRMRDGATSSKSASSRMTALFALPWAGVAVVRINSRPSRTSSTSLRLARGCTRRERTSSSPACRTQDSRAGMPNSLQQPHEQSYHGAEGDQCEYRRDIETADRRDEASERAQQRLCQCIHHRHRGIVTARADDYADDD